MGFNPQTFQTKKPLSKSEQIAVEHFRKNPGGRGFFSVAEIMAKHDNLDEAIQLLAFGLERHPSYSVARVYLAQLYLRRTHVQESFETIENSPLPLKGNLTAQLLRLKLCVLLGREAEVVELVKDVSRQEFEDKDIQIILKQLEMKPFEQLRRDFADYLRIPLAALPQASKISDAKPAPNAAESDSDRPSEEGGDVAPQPLEPEAEMQFRRRVAQGFFASSISELFQKPDALGSQPSEELEPLTFARLLRRQGLYERAAEIYRRLALELPGNDLLKREYKEIVELREAQKKIDQAISPEVVMTMEKVRKIDARLRLLNELLSGLDNLQHEPY